MRITFVASKLDLQGGGSNRSLDLMCRHLSRRGHAVTLVTTHPSKNDLTGDEPYGVVESSLGEPGNFYSLSRSTYENMAAMDDDTDLFHVFKPDLIPAGGFFQERHGTPVVGRLNSMDIVCSNWGMMDDSCYKHCSVFDKFRHDDNPLSKRLGKLLSKYPTMEFLGPAYLNKVEKLFALSTGIEEVYRYNGVDEASMTVIPNFLNTGLAGAAPDPDERRGERRRFLYVGRLVRSKNVRTVLEAAARTTEADFHVDVVGDGPERGSLEALADRLGLDGRVTFHGHQPHDRVSEYYRSADAFVHPMTGPYTFSRTVLEALQFDLPVVVADAGDAIEMLDGVGLTYTRGDPDSLARLFDSLVTDPTPLDEVEREIPTVRSRFEPDAVVDRVEREYRDAVEGG